MQRERDGKTGHQPLLSATGKRAAAAAAAGAGDGARCRSRRRSVVAGIGHVSWRFLELTFVNEFFKLGRNFKGNCSNFKL